MANKSLSEALGLEHLENYYRALGQFVSRFSYLEACMQTALWEFTGIKQPIAGAVFSGTRAEAASQYIKRIAEAKAWPAERIKDLDYVLQQLGVITRIRNDILHYGAQPVWEGNFPPLGSKEWLVSNKRIAHTPERVRETKITTDILSDLTTDILKIVAHLMVLMRPDNEQIRIMFAEDRERAWRYKPEQPSIQSGKPRRNIQRRGRQQKPSQG